MTSDINACGYGVGRINPGAWKNQQEQTGGMRCSPGAVTTTCVGTWIDFDSSHTMVMCAVTESEKAADGRNREWLITFVLDRGISFTSWQDCWTCYRTSKNLWGKWQVEITLNLRECAGLWETGSCDELGAGEVKGTISSSSALCDTVRVWGCTSGKHLDQFRACIPLCASSLCSHFLVSCTLSWWCWFRTQLHISQPGQWWGFHSPWRAAVQPPGPWDCLRAQLSLRWATWCTGTVLWDTLGCVAGFREWSGEDGLFIARDRNQPKCVDCEFLVDF